MPPVWAHLSAQGVHGTLTLTLAIWVIFFMAKPKHLLICLRQESKIKTTSAYISILQQHFRIFHDGFSGDAHVHSISGSWKDIFLLQWYAKCWWFIYCWKAGGSDNGSAWVIFPASQSCLGQPRAHAPSTWVLLARGHLRWLCLGGFWGGGSLIPLGHQGRPRAARGTIWAL